MLHRAIKLEPGNASLHHYLGYCLWKETRLSLASRELRTANSLDPGNAYTFYFLGRIAQAEAKPALAIRYYKGELALGSALYDTYQVLGQAYLDTGQLAQARATIEQAIRQAPWDGSLHYQLARIDLKRGRRLEAQQEFATSERLKRIDQASIQRLLELYQAIQTHRRDRISDLRESQQCQSDVLNASYVSQIQTAQAGNACQTVQQQQSGLTNNMLGLLVNHASIDSARRIDQETHAINSRIAKAVLSNSVQDHTSGIDASFNNWGHN